MRKYYRYRNYGATCNICGKIPETIHDNGKKLKCCNCIEDTEFINIKKYRITPTFKGVWVEMNYISMKEYKRLDKEWQQNLK